MPCTPQVEDRTLLVLTFHPRFRRYAFRELKDLDADAAEAQRLDVDSSLVSTTLGPRAQEAVAQSKPIFIQHTAPARVSVGLSWTREDLPCLVEAAGLVPPEDAQRTFAVQCRVGRRPPSINKEASYSSKDVEVAVGSHFEREGFRPDFAKPEQALSIYLSEQTAYLGSSDARWNLSVQADEHRRFSATPPAISRAEFKLREAIATFGLEGAIEGRAIDAGASPGGWTKVLADLGMQVVAVDPGALHKSLSIQPGVEHLKVRLEDTSFEEGSFDLAVNDMNLDPGDSAELMCRVAKWLKPGSPAVMTIKLPYRNMLGAIRHAERVLQTEYEVESIRHLFHNRQEVTALLRRR